MKNTFTLYFAYILILCLSGCYPADRATGWKSLEKPLNLYLANDLGRNGYYDQKDIASTMGKMAEAIDIEAIIAAGDVHHFEGVRSVDDPLWMTNYELIYSHPELMIPWFAVAGNHEYRGSVQSVIDYSKVSARWNMPQRYYTMVMENDGIEIRIIMLDTPPLIDKYRKDSLKYPEACLQNADSQLEWLDSTLAAAKEQWIVVVGHHPIYADTDKNESERKDMQMKVDPILRKYGNVDMYLCGHIHNFQHIRTKGSDIEYVVNGSGSLGRDVKPVEGTVFCSDKTGYSLISADEKELVLTMLDKDGNILHKVVCE